MHGSSSSLPDALMQILTRELPDAAAFHAAWPGWLNGCDVSGRVVWCERMNAIDLTLLTKMEEASLAILRAQSMEALCLRKRADALARGPGRGLLKHIYVLDATSFNALRLVDGAGRRVVKLVSSISSTFYTNSLFRCYVVGVNPVVRAAWAVVRTMVHPDTAAKVRLVGSAEDFLRAAEADGIPASSLPCWLGGSHAGQSLQEAVAAALAAAGEMKQEPATPEEAEA